MNVAFCINRLALIGLGPTVSSLVRNCSDSSKLTLWFLGADLYDSDKENIRALLTSESFKGKSQFIDFDPVAHFGQFRSLHGDWTPYGRLLIPELLVNEDKVLYLDADLIVEIDVLDLDNVDLNNHAIGAIPGAQIKHAIESKFFIDKILLSPEDRYFNSGILLMDLIVWRAQEIKNQCLALAKLYSNELLAVDQTILNALFSRDFFSLPLAFNCPWYADKERPKLAEKMILHYVGSPKPWDIFGVNLHKGYSTWGEYLIKDWSKFYNQTTISKLSRAWKIRKSYFRILKKKLNK